MIRNSFIFLPGIGNTREKILWDEGILNWDHFLDSKEIKRITPSKKIFYDQKINEARKHLHSYNSEYFTNLLRPVEAWRLYDYFKEDTVYLDIETDGLNSWNDITVIGLYDGIRTKTMIKDINLNYKALKEELSKYKMIVTFNGASFDLPFIQKRYPNVLPKVPHFDLRFACKRIGLSGGLKKIEQELGMQRRDLVRGLDGGDALTLWKMYKGSGDEHYLNLLVEYNEEDIINLKKIAHITTQKLKEKINYNKKSD